MRSNKDILLRVVAGILGIAVLACAAYTLAYFNRGKDWRDYTPIERIAALTPKHASRSINDVLGGGSETWVVRDARVVDGFVVFFPRRFQDGPPTKLTPRLVQVGPEMVQTEIVRGSEMEKTILACLDRAISSGEVDVRSLRGMLVLRARLTKDQFSQGYGARAD
jgi:hypothetical protein